MHLDDLETALRSGGDRDDLRRRWDTYRQQGGDEDAAAFLAYLHRQELISTRDLCELLGGSRLELEAGDRAATGSGSWTGDGEADGGGKYRFLSPVGSGAMGQVHAAKDLRLNRHVAVKEMNPAQARRPAKVAEFLHEIQITAQLDHPNIVPVYDLEQGREHPAYSMKLVHGQTLADLIDGARELAERGAPVDDEHSLDTRLDHFLKVCDAVAYAHSRGVVHRDLKPENVMVGAFNEVYVMDWGLAKVIDEERHRAPGEVLGTPAYMSPEQAVGDQELVGLLSDQYTLGLILFELAYLQRARGGSGLRVVALAAGGVIDPVDRERSRSAKVSADLAAIIGKATAVAPAGRYADVEALADDLRRYQRGESTEARPDNRWRSLLRWMARHREVAMSAVLAVLLGAAALTIAALLDVQRVRQAAHQREARLSAHLSQVAEQAARAELYFLRLEGLLKGLADSALHLLISGAASPDRLYFSSDFDDPGTAPADLVTVPRYRTPVSFAWPSFTLVDGVRLADVRPTLERLIPLRHQFQRTFLGSFSETGRDRGELDAMLHFGVAPLIWAYVALEDGVHMSYPGHTGYPVGFDPRKRPWYGLGALSRQPTWGNPYIDVNGQGLILPCVEALVSPAGDERLLGVAGIELTFDLIIDALLQNPELDDVRETYLVDGRGRVMVSIGARDVAAPGGLHGNEELETETLAVPEVVAAVRQGRSGFFEEDGELWVYQRLEALGWHLVVWSSGDFLSEG
ncbi:MAG: serine/threonine protein kinase [Thermoanaerobaculia bacterium]